MNTTSTAANAAVAASISDCRAVVHDMAVPKRAVNAMATQMRRHVPFTAYRTIMAMIGRREATSVTTSLLNRRRWISLYIKTPVSTSAALLRYGQQS